MMIKVVKTSITKRVCETATRGTLVVAILATLTGTASAAPKPDSCPTSITSCGCTITQPGTYTVTDDLDATQSLHMSSGGNGGSFDLIDNNANCDGDLWFNNTFGNPSQSCIH
jgi:hypothetical protein